jgi:uncharacterized membrane protein
MIFLAVLAVATAGASIALAVFDRFDPRRAARFGFAIALAFAGLSHLLMPAPFLQHLPEWVPMRTELVFITGVIEIALGATLLTREPWRRRAGWATAWYLVAVFPGNLYVAVADVEVDGQPGGVYPWLRLPLQALFIAWVLWSTRDSAPSGLEPGADLDSWSRRLA